MFVIKLLRGDRIQPRPFSWKSGPAENTAPFVCSSEDPFSEEDDSAKGSKQQNNAQANQCHAPCHVSKYVRVESTLCGL